ncbi:uncharacterized protein [Miscanthus floridulus]|uniref:uncharacterized protein n=1 Tax=Miscanthus floridulus TaxID=154761 RepID=UPI003459E4F8
MENNGRLLPNDALVEEVPALKPLPLCGRSKFVVSTARREILGGALHRTELPPTLQGFFYGDGIHDEEDYLPCKNYGRFARLPGTTTSVDPSLSFLSKALPGNRHIFLVDACNGLLLLGHMPDSYFWPEFVVCNPATQQWVAVPSCVDWVDMDDDGDLRNDPRMFTLQTHISLLFDPAVSSHFQVLVFWNWHLIDDDQGTTTVHAYSSETGVWRNSESDSSPEERRGPLEVWRRQITFDNFILQGSPGAFVNGMLYLNLAWCKMILQVDTEGKTRGMFPAPPVQADAGNKVLFVGRSQGLLHCILEGPRQLPGQRLNRRYRKKWRSHELSIWVLGDMDRLEWVSKHKVSRRQLFGSRTRMHVYRLVTMHPDCNMVFFHLRRGDDHPMISYDFDRREVQVVETYKHHPTYKIIPFAPYLSELFLGVLGAHK